jgi:putative membrane protein insertion efficiency factor
MRTKVSRILWVAGTPARALLLGAILAYRGLSSGMAGGRCRFHPSCSTYALDAVRVHGAVKGSILAVWRILRCSPLTPGGLDPVPPGRRWRAEAEV